MARRAAKMPVVAYGTSAQLLLMEVAPLPPSQGILPVVGGFDEKWGNRWLAEIQARPVEAKCVPCK